MGNCSASSSGTMTPGFCSCPKTGRNTDLASFISCQDTEKEVLDAAEETWPLRDSKAGRNSSEPLTWQEENRQGESQIIFQTHSPQITSFGVIQRRIKHWGWGCQVTN